MDSYKVNPLWYDVRGFFILVFAYNSTLKEQVLFFGRNLGNRHLEVACGTGTLLAMVLRWRRSNSGASTNIIALDSAPSMLKGAEHRFAKQSNIQLILGDVCALPFPSHSFDTINIANALHCFSNITDALAEVARVLKPRGTLAANVLLYPRGPFPLNLVARRINSWGIKKGILETPYRLEEVRNKVINAGFQVTSESVSGNCYYITATRYSSGAEQ